METGWRRYGTLAAIFVLTGGGLVAWIAAVFLIWLLLRAAGDTASYWVMVEALSTAVAAAAVFGAGFVAYRELNEVSMSRYLEVADRLFEELNAPESIEARRVVYTELPDDPEAGLASMDPETRAAVKRVLNSLDRVAFLTQSGWIPEAVIMPWMNPMVVKAWTKLGPYVAQERERRGESDYYASAESLAERCLRWRQKHLPEPEVRWIEGAL